MSRRANSSVAAIAAELRRTGGVVEHAERALGFRVGRWLMRYPELAALTRGRGKATDRSAVLPWTHPASPWMASVDIEVEQHETGGIGAGWSRMSKTGRAA